MAELATIARPYAEAVFRVAQPAKLNVWAEILSEMAQVAAVPAFRDIAGDPRFARAQLADIFEKAGLPFAPIVKPEALFDDPHLQATGGLADVRLTDGDKAGQTAAAALLPFTMGGQRLGVRHQPPYQGENTDDLLRELGLTPQDIQRMRAARAVG